MLFNSPLYGVFLVATLVVFWILRRNRLARILFLILASYGFYFYGTYDDAREKDFRLEVGALEIGPGAWAALCLGIIFVGSSLDFAIGRALGRIQHQGKRRALLLVSIFYYLGVLALFKYWNLAADSFAWAAHQAGWEVNVTHLRLILPFGISFFTFETMSYTIDVYRRHIEPADRYLDYLLFVCFFPHLVAGPIVRPKDMLPQFRVLPKADAEMQSRGLWLIATGLAKKIVIGDYLATNLVKRVFENPERYSSLELLIGVYAYAVQIYSDFSGYTDVALGSSLLFGYKLPTNFDQPYTAVNLQDFWHRWHISLSTWLRDYLYKPLGGSRGPAWKTYRNLMITMVLGGLWHGATSWNFVIWGALHGLVLAGTRMWQRWREKRGAPRAPGLPGRVIGVLLTFHFVCFAWIFFRAPTFAHARVFLARMGEVTTDTTHLTKEIVALVVVAMVIHFLPRKWTDWVRENAFVRSPAVVQGIVLAAAAVGLHFAAQLKATPFVYGQF